MSSTLVSILHVLVYLTHNLGEVSNNDDDDRSPLTVKVIQLVNDSDRWDFKPTSLTPECLRLIALQYKETTRPLHSDSTQHI